MSKNEAQEYAETIAREIRDAFIDGTMGEVAESVLDVSIIKGADGEVRGVKLLRTCGGPHCWIDTDDQTVYCIWGTDFGRFDLWRDECEALEEYFIFD